MNVTRNNLLYMDSERTTDDILPYLEDLKISAFKKLDLIKNQIHEVTLGPNSSFGENEDTHITKSTPPKGSGKSLDKKSFVTKTPECNKKISPKKNPELSDAPETDALIPFRQVLKEYELSRQQEVREAIQNHSKKFVSFSAEQDIIRKHNRMLQEQKHEHKMQLFQEELALALKKYDEEKINDQKRLDEYHQKLDEERKKVAAALEAKRRENELTKQCLNMQGQFQSTFQEIMVNIKNIQEKELKMELFESWKHCKELSELMTALMAKCKECVSEQAKDMIEIVLNRMNELKVNIDHIMKSYEEKKEQKAKNEAENSNASQSNSVPESTVLPRQENVEENESSVSSLNEYIGKSQLEKYTAIMDFHQKYSESFKELLQHDNYKQFRFDCKKAVNLSVNTISAANSQHLLDKYVKLSNLLSGRNVVIGDLQITASKHPKGVPYCIDLLAAKFVLQGDLMVAGNPESAFPFASVIVSIWNESQDFGKLLLASFYKECPYLIPYYPPRIVDQTDQDYYKSQGYRYNDNKVEEQDKFLKRMTGTMRLYFAILITLPKRSQDRHPYYIEHAWTWIVAALKLKPRIDITATMFHSFFETIGFEMQNVYGKQFMKLVRYFIEHYFPLTKKIDTGGPVTRLECLLQEFRENGNKFKAPKGLVPRNYW